MKLPLPFLEKKQDLTYFLVLVLRHNRASAVIFEETAGTAKVISSHSEPFQTSIEDADDEELLNTLDKTISKAESILPQNVETQKTIFGLKENWIDENSKIQKEYLGKLKKISDDLGLTPIGFLVTTEAIVHELAKDEGAPVSAILAQIDKDLISVSLVRAGKIIEVQNGPVSGSAADDVDNLLKHFENVEVLPSRIIIFNGEEDLSQEFISHSWSKTLPFLHLPQITDLESGFDAKAVLSGAAIEMGFQVLGDSAPARKTTAPAEEMAEDLPVVDIGQKTAAHIEDKSPIEEEIPEKEDVVDEELPSEMPTETAEVKDTSSDSFGFVKEKDVAGEKVANKEAVVDEVEQNFTILEEPIAKEIEEIPNEMQVEESETKPLAMNAAIILAGARKILPIISTALSKTLSKAPALKNLPIRGNKIILFPAVLVLLFIFLFIYYLTGRSAIVTLNISAKKVTSQKDVTFSTTQKTDASQNIIAGQFTQVTENGSSSTNATGSKDIGTPSKGTVTVFNIGDTATLTQGTKITSSNNLTFTLDKSVTVASGSADPFNPSSGKADVTVTAADIGTNYNLPSNTKFSFQGNNSIAAKNDNPFSGGTKKTITVISKDDAAKLETDLAKSLETKAKDEIVNKIPDGSVLLPVFVSETLDSKNFSKNVGDEAGNVTLKANVTYKSVSYNKSDMATFVKGLMQIPSGQTLDENSIRADASNLKASDNQVDTTLNISAFLIPVINRSDLAKQISGKSISDAQKLLAKIPQVSDTLIKISPNIPLFPKNLPGSSKIKFTINSNE